MSPCWLVVPLLALIGLSSQTETCEDLIPTCASLQSICIGTILEYHFNVLGDITDQVNSSSIPALESSLPLLESDIPLVLGTGEGSNDEGTTTAAASGSAYEDALKNAIPLLKESLPLIRESLPLIRESLPLIRQYLDPIAGTTGCQRKATCRSCRECPKLRDTIISFVESLCPSTCKVCATGGDAETTGAALSSFFT